MLGVAVASVASGPGGVAAQTARDFRGPPGIVPLTTAEPPARLIVDPPGRNGWWMAASSSPYRTENLRIVSVFGPATLAVTPRIGHIHVTLDDLPWHWADASGEPIIIVRLAPDPHRVWIDLMDANHRTLDSKQIEFTVP